MSFPKTTRTALTSTQIKINISKTPPVLAKFIKPKQLVAEKSRASYGVVRRALIELEMGVKNKVRRTKKGVRFI